MYQSKLTFVSKAKPATVTMLCNVIQAIKVSDEAIVGDNNILSNGFRVAYFKHDILQNAPEGAIVISKLLPVLPVLRGDLRWLLPFSRVL